MSQSNRKIGPSATDLIAGDLLAGESVDMGSWEAEYIDAYLNDAEQGGELSFVLLLWNAGRVSDDRLREAIRKAAEDYAERYEADWISARKKQRMDEDIRGRDEDRHQRIVY